MSIKILNAETMRKNLIGKVRNIRLYDGTAKENAATADSKIVHEETIKIVNEKWIDSAGREELLRKRRNLEEKAQKNFNERKENASVGYDMKTIRELAALYTIDLTRQAEEFVDYTPTLYKEIFDENVPESANLRDMANYVGKEEVITGTGDTAPLMQPALPEDYTVKQEIRGFGDHTTYRQLIFNPFHKTELIINSAARILVDGKNHDSLGPILKADYDALHKQAADTIGATYDLKVYNTFKRAVRKARRLFNVVYDKQNGLYNPEAYLLINPMDLDDVLPIISGALASVGGLMQLAPAINFAGIIPYGGGLNDGMKWGNETLSYPGVPLGKAYIFMKVDSFGGYRVTKRNETMEMGQGDIMALTSEKRVWHRIRGMYHDFVLPKEKDGKGYGALVEVTLPEFA